MIGAGVGLGRPFYSLGASEWLGKVGMDVCELDILALGETGQRTARALGIGYMALSRWPGLYNLVRSSLDRSKIQLTDRKRLAERLGNKNILSVLPVASGELIEAGVEHRFVAGDFYVHESVRNPKIRSIYVPVEGLVEGSVVIGGAVLPTIFAQRELSLSRKIGQLKSGRIPEVGFVVNGAGADMVSWLRSAADAIGKGKIKASFFVGTSSKLYWAVQDEARRMGIDEKVKVLWTADLRQAVQLKSGVTAESDVVVSPTANENILARPTIFRSVRNSAERANDKFATERGWGMRAGSSDEMAEVLGRLSDNRSEGLGQMLRKLENNLVMDAGEKMARSVLDGKV